MARKRLDYRARWQEKRQQRLYRRRVITLAGLGAVALVLVVLVAGQRPRAAASYTLPRRDICWLTPGEGFLLVCQREGRLARLGGMAGAMFEAGAGWARAFTHPAGFCGRVTLAGELALVSCADGRLRAVDVRSGEQVWERVAAGAAAEAAAAGGAAFFGADNGHLYAVKLSDGTPLWQVNLGAAIASAPLVTDEQVIVGTIAGVVHCVDRGTGRKRWRFRDPERVGPIYASPRSGPNSILVGSDDGKLCNISREGELINSFQVGGLIRAPVAVAGGWVIVGDSAGRLCRVNQRDMTEKWCRRLSRAGGITAEPIVVGDRIWCAAGKYLVCLRTDTGRVLWRRKGSAQTTDCVRSGQSLYWATADGVVRAVRTAEAGND